MQADTTITAMGLIREALTQIARNRRWLLPIMGVIWLLQLPSFFSAENFIPQDAMELMGLPPGAASLIPAVIVMLAVYIGTAWSAVGWHRLTLMDERPAQALPRWHTQPILGYFVVSIFLPLLTWGLPALAVLPVLALLMALDAPMTLTEIAALPAGVMAIWLSLRLSPVQVSRAVQNPAHIAEAFRRTAHMSRPLWGVALLGGLCLTALVGSQMLVTPLLTDAEGYYLSDTVMFLDGTLFWATFFLFFLLTISIFNTIYRHMAPDTEPAESR